MLDLFSRTETGVCRERRKLPFHQLGSWTTGQCTTVWLVCLLYPLPPPPPPPPPPLSLSPTPTCGLEMTKHPVQVFSVSAQFISGHDGANPSLRFSSSSVVLAVLLIMIITLARSPKSLTILSVSLSVPPSLSVSICLSVSLSPPSLSLSLFLHICRNTV